jgi:predicted RNase H-like HicB family nuclease
MSSVVFKINRTFYYKGDNDRMADIKDYAVSVKGNEKEGYIAMIKALNCVGDGNTIQEAIEDVREVGRAFLKIAETEGRKIPESDITDKDRILFE